MWSRTRFDVGWRDLAFGVGRCLVPPDRAALARRVERRFSPDDDALACYSVRSGFDLLLQALDLPAGSEVLFSAVNIKGMVKAARRLDLVPVPVDLDLSRLAPRPEALERAIGPRSRVLVVAPLFGARLDLGPIAEIARRHGLFLVEDGAQAFAGPGHTGHPAADASLFSFGPLKTATALGGALARVADPALLARMRAIQAGYPVQATRPYLSRLLKFAALKSATYRLPARLVHRSFAAAEGDVDGKVTDAVRGLARQKGAKAIRQRPCGAMLALLERRLARFPAAGFAARVARAERLRGRLRGHVVCPGADNAEHGFWAFPIQLKDPAPAIAALRDHGFDAANVVSLLVVPAPEDRPELAPGVAEELLDGLVFLPCYGAMPAAEIDREADVLLRALAAAGA